MEQSYGRWLKLLFLLWILSFSQARELKVKDNGPLYNHTLATILVEYASAVYMSDLTKLFTWTCSRCNGLTKGFEVLELIVDVQNCLQAFVGVAEDLNALVVSFRGTQEHSIQNWVEDLFCKQLDLNYPGMPDAMVHQGFYYAYHNTTLRHGVLHAIKRAKTLYGDIPVMVTGHSMGGAMASFCALDLVVNCGTRNVQLMTFGQPRIGNAAFASYFNQHVPNTFRITNAHDMVPHLPPYYTYFPTKTYHHFAREVWLHNIGLGSLVYPVEKVCDDSGEDPSCSRSVSGNSIIDHLAYFGVELMAETWTSCRIVMNTIEENYGVIDPGGNLILSRDPTRCGGTGGIIRDREGRVVLAFAQPLSQISSAYQAEVNALKLGLKIAMQAGFSSLEIESDCKELVTKIQQAEIDPGPDSMLVEEVKLVFASLLETCSIKFVPRTCNKVADTLAKLGSKSREGQIWWNSCPLEVQNLVAVECLNL